MTHELKIERQWADAKLAGEKPFEIRRNDRGFQKGDTVRYTVIDPKTKEPLEHVLTQCDFLITYVREGAAGLQQGYCVYADAPVLRSPATVAPPVGKNLTVAEPPDADKSALETLWVNPDWVRKDDAGTAVSTTMPNVTYEYRS